MKIVLKSFCVLMITLIVCSTNVLAVSESDLTEINESIDQTKSKLEGVENERSQTMLEISKISKPLDKCT